MVFVKGWVGQNAPKKVVAKVETPNMIRVRNRWDKTVIIIDANKEKDYKTKYLHVSWNNFTD